MIKSIYKYFLKSDAISTDTRHIEKNSLFFALKGDNFNANKFAAQAIEKGASYAIIDEKEYNTSERTILVDNVLETLQELATYHRKKLGIPIIALTGSNGKTTTKELINVVLSKNHKTTATKGNLNNHIGVPLTLLSMTKDTEIGIVEMGANHPKEIKFLCKIAQPDYGYITNFGKAHLEGFGSLEGVIKAKTELYAFLKKNKKKLFLNNYDQTQVSQSKGINSISFGLEKSDFIIQNKGAKPYVKLKFDNTIISSNLIGAYNFNNLAVAIAIGKYFAVKTKAIKNAIENYHPTNNRSQIIDKGSNQIILDAYNANPSSMLCALENLNQIKATTKIAILGDMFELGDFAKQEHQFIVDLMRKFEFEHVYLLGDNFLKTSNHSKNTTLLKDFNAFKDFFEEKTMTDTTILIKASRGMALERIVDLI